LRSSVLNCGFSWSDFGLGWLLGRLLVSLLLLGNILLLLTIFVSLLLSILALLLLISVLSILFWRSLLEVLLVVVTLVVALVLVLVWAISIFTVPLLSLPWLVLNKHLLLVSVEAQVLNLSLHSNWSWAQILIWVESTEGSHLSETGNLDEGWWLRVQWAELEWTDRWRAVLASRIIVVALTAVVLVVLSLVATVSLLWHWWQSDSFW